MPSACGMPPRSGSSQTRFDSCSANWPSVKNASRGVVATQFGLPRPASRNWWVAAFCCEKSRAQRISSSLSWKGLSAPYWLASGFVPWVITHLPL